MKKINVLVTEHRWYRVSNVEVPDDFVEDDPEPELEELFSLGILDDSAPNFANAGTSYEGETIERYFQIEKIRNGKKRR